MGSSTTGTGRPTWRSGGDSEDEELENSPAYKNYGKTALLLILDSTPDMFRPSWGGNNETPFRAALKCCVSRCRSKIVSYPRDLVGILFAGTEKEQNTPSFPNLYLLQPMAQLRAELIEELHQMAMKDDHNGFEDRIGSSSTYNLKDMFWLSKIIYENAKVGSFSQKVIYFTCEDNPHSRNRNLRNDSIQKFKDLGQVDFSIVTFKADFEHEHFYKSLFPDASRITFPKDMKDLVEVVRVKEKAKRPLCRSSLQIFPGVKIAVGVYSLARAAASPKQFSVNERNNELVTKTVNSFRADTGMTVLKSEQVKVATLLGETVEFSKDELNMSKTSVNTGIVILGFLARSKFDEFTSFRADGFFLYPDEERITGSTDAFTTLLRRCHALEKVAVVKMVLTRGRTAKLAVLIPSVEGISASSRLLPANRGSPPCGFYVFQLPFADELRTHEIPTGREASEELTEFMEKIVRKVFNKNFDLQTIQNPKLQLLYRQIENIAIQADGQGFEDEEFMDSTEPNEEGMHTRIGAMCEAFNEEVSAEGLRNAVVRQAPPQKQLNMAMEVKNRRVDKLTRTVIAEFLESRGVKTAGKVKAQVVQMLYSFFEDGGS